MTGETEDSEPNPRPSTRRRKQGRILVVEDDKNVRTGLTLLFQGEGYDVIQAENASGGFLKAITTSPDLFVLDIIMPVRNGFALCKKLKSDERFKSIPILLLSALSQEEQKSERNWKGKPAADDFVSKPYKAQDLLRRVDKLLSAKTPKTPF